MSTHFKFWLRLTWGWKVHLQVSWERIKIDKVRKITTIKVKFCLEQNWDQFPFGLSHILNNTTLWNYLFCWMHWNFSWSCTWWRGLPPRTNVSFVIYLTSNIVFKESQFSTTNASNFGNKEVNGRVARHLIKTDSFQQLRWPTHWNISLVYTMGHAISLVVYMVFWYKYQQQK